MNARLGDHQIRGWRGWHHHMTLVMMAMLFLLEARQLRQQIYLLLRGFDMCFLQRINK